MNSLKDFYINESMRNDVKAYLIDFLKEKALEKLFDDTYEKSLFGFAEAKMVIESAFENLEVLFSPKVKEKEMTNQAR